MVDVSSAINVILGEHNLDLMSELVIVVLVPYLTGNINKPGVVNWSSVNVVVRSPHVDKLDMLD